MYMIILDFQGTWFDVQKFLGKNQGLFKDLSFFQGLLSQNNMKDL